MAPMLTILAFALVLVQTQSVPAQEVPPIRNFLRVTTDFCTGGQPRPEHMAQLKADGVKSVLNLRQPSEHRADDERAAAETAGLKYFNIPVEYGNPKDEQADEFL